ANPADVFAFVTYRVNHRKLNEAMTGVMIELILRECIEEAQAESSLSKPRVDNNVKIELRKNDIRKENERSQKYREGIIGEFENIVINKAPHSDNIKDEHLNERGYKAEKFEAIMYSLGPNKEYIAINNYE
nr:hypothetical protein [Tanacetum cinerariifolium]